MKRFVSLGSALMLGLVHSREKHLSQLEEYKVDGDLTRKFKNITALKKAAQEVSDSNNDVFDGISEDFSEPSAVADKRPDSPMTSKS
jgi:hypothetical protein